MPLEFQSDLLLELRQLALWVGVGDDVINKTSQMKRDDGPISLQDEARMELYYLLIQTNAPAM